MPSGKAGSYKWYDLVDVTKIKENICSNNINKYINGAAELAKMGLLTKEYAEKLNEHERLYEDDGK